MSVDFRPGMDPTGNAPLLYNVGCTIMRIVPADKAHLKEWLEMRLALWPECRDSDSQKEIEETLSSERATAFIALHGDRPSLMIVSDQVMAIGPGKPLRAEHVASDIALYRKCILLVEDHNLSRLGRLMGEVEPRPAISDHPVTPVETGRVEEPGVGEQVFAEVAYAEVLHAGYAIDRRGLLLDGLGECVVGRVSSELSVFSLSRPPLAVARFAG